MAGAFLTLRLQARPGPRDSLRQSRLLSARWPRRRGRDSCTASVSGGIKRCIRRAVKSSCEPFGGSTTATPDFAPPSPAVEEKTVTEERKEKEGEEGERELATVE